MVKNLRKLREERGFSQQKLAEQLDLSQQSICKYENNIAEPDIETLIRLADFFYTSVDYLVGHTDEKDLQAIELSNNELQHIKMFRRLSRTTQKSIDIIMADIVDTL